MELSPSARSMAFRMLAELAIILIRFDVTAHRRLRSVAGGDQWVHLRLCLFCGHVGCCDDSRNKHATAHFHSTRHPIIESLEPGEDWRWCYVDEVLFPSEIDGADVPAGESENVMPDISRSPVTAINEATLSASHSLPLVGDISANGRGGGMFKSICRRVRRCNKKNLEPTIELAVEIAREGREVGALAPCSPLAMPMPCWPARDL